jgi:hypothetical protein
MRAKVLDNTVITAFLKEINCLDLIDICSSSYELVTSIEVSEEANEGFSAKPFK